MDYDTDAAEAGETKERPLLKAIGRWQQTLSRKWKQRNGRSIFSSSRSKMGRTVFGRAGLRWLAGAGSTAELTPAQLNVSGQIVVAGRSTPYLIRHLPVSSFPELPARTGRPAEPPRLPDSADLRGASPGECGSRQPGAGGLLRLGGALLGAGNGLAAGLLFQRSGEVAGAGLRAGDRAACRPTTRAAFSASTGASIPPRPSRFARRRPACCIARRGWTTTRWPIRWSSTALSTTSI